MIVDLPPAPAPHVARIEASFPMPAAPLLYEYLSAMEGEAPPRGVPVRRFRRSADQYALVNPINDILDRLGFYFRTLLPETWNKNGLRKPLTGSGHGGNSGGFGDKDPGPVPTGDPIPVDGGGKPNGG
jgi:hypothetical protein